jgi:hypothetical protein
MNPDEFIAKTEFGKFRVKIKGDFISIGGKRFCVQISYRNESDIELTSLETRHGGCELNNKEIHGDLTVHMVHLAFTILRINYPGVRTVNLTDTSSFICENRPMGLMKTSLLLYGQTYYERRFGATPVKAKEIDKINNFRAQWNNTKLPTKFNFVNKELSTLLTPIYESCSTWAEFASKLNGTFGRQVCKYIYPWFLDAVYTIYDEEITTRWLINIADKPVIQYEKLPFSGGRRTLKNIKYTVVYRPDWDRNGVFDIKYT